MTDRPQRPSTIVPPPDRDRKTDPPLPTDKAPPEIVTLSENVLLRLDGIENGLIEVNARLGKLDELHALLMGAPAKEPGGKPLPSIISALHDLVGPIAIAGANSEMVAEQQKTLPEIIAETVANKVVALYQEEIRSLREADAALLARVERIAEVAGIGTNGNGSHK